MKELSIEEKAKAYDEAIEKAKSKIKNDKDHVLYEDDVIEILPELKESEDEKTKRLLHTIVNKMSQHLRDIFTEEEYQCFDAWSNAWLEKQGEKTNPYSGTSFEYNGHIWGMCARDNGVDILLDKQLFKHLEKQGEQKPVKASYTTIVETGNGSINAVVKRELSTDECYGEQKPAEWSEEDENIYNAILDTIYNNLGLCSIHRDWFKNIKERLKSLRPQSHWKPNKEQIVALECAVNDIQRFSSKSLTLQVENEPYWRNLVSLLKQLKKL